MKKEITMEEFEVALKANDRLIYLEGFGWWNKDQAYPPANYYPPGSLAQLPEDTFETD